jgi:hypothetical protein
LISGTTGSFKETTEDDEPDADEDKFNQYWGTTGIEQTIGIALN